MKVSLIMPTLNEGKNIEVCIKTLLRQSFKNYEIIIVDGGSSDDTVQKVKKFKNKKIKLIKFKSNIPEAYNYALKTTKSEIVGILEADGEYPKEFLQKCMKQFRDFKFGGVCPQAYYPEKGFFSKILNLYRQTRLLDKNGPRACKFYRRKAIEDVGFFNEKLNVGEDYDIVQRIKKKGYIVEWAPETSWIHHESGRSNNIINSLIYSFKEGYKRGEVNLTNPERFITQSTIWPIAIIFFILGILNNFFYYFGMVLIFVLFLWNVKYLIYGLKFTKNPFLLIYLYVYLLVEGLFKGIGNLTGIIFLWKK